MRTRKPELPIQVFVNDLFDKVRGRKYFVTVQTVGCFLGEMGRRDVRRLVRTGEKIKFCRRKCRQVKCIATEIDHMHVCGFRARYQRH